MPTYSGGELLNLVQPFFVTDIRSRLYLCVERFDDPYLLLVESLRRPTTGDRSLFCLYTLVLGALSKGVANRSPERSLISFRALMLGVKL